MLFCSFAVIDIVLNVITVVRIVAAASDAAWFGGSGLVTSCKQAALGTLRSILAAFTGQEALVGCVGSPSLRVVVGTLLSFGRLCGQSRSR